MMIVAILGAGTMGRGIAQVFATAGCETRVFDLVPRQAEGAVAAVGVRLERLVANGRLDSAERERALGLLRVAKSAGEACAAAELVLEAAPESMELKAALLGQVVTGADPSALFASNTSSLSITELGARIRVPARTIGLHFFNPAPVMELVEVVRGLETSDATLDRALALVRAVKKTPIVVRDSPGFATSRLGLALGAEAIRMLESGVADAGDIDRAMELGYRHPMGPLKLTDLVGLDVRLAILEHLHDELGEVFRPPVLLRQMVRAGKLGKKTGEGFYVWREGEALPDRPAIKGP